MSTHRYGRLSVSRNALAAFLAVAVAFTSPFELGSLAQTKITPPPNKYSVADDVKLGREASAEVRKELPLLNDGRTDDYVEDVGRRLVAAIPPEFQHDEFRYSFDIINQKEINAFALPGGPMYLNRGMIQAAKTEGEVAGVMAHEISHVALRHGTANATKAQKPAILGTIGQVVGAIIGGGLGQAIYTGSEIGAGLTIMKYGREYERQADLLGAQILARAGYNPVEMANMFRTIEKEGGGGGGPEWMSSHPNPGNRYNAIIAEAKSLRVQGNANTGQFQSVHSRLNQMSPAPTAEQIARGQGRTEPTGAGSRTVRVEPPSSSYRTDQPAEFLRVSVPSNWDNITDRSGVTYAPEGAVFQSEGGGTAFTHGVQIGVGQGSGNLQRDTQNLLNGFARSNPNLRQEGNLRRDSVGGRTGYTTVLSNVSEVTGQAERVAFSTTQLRNGSVLYVIGVAPQNEAGAYDNAFRRVRQSLQIADR